MITEMGFSAKVGFLVTPLWNDFFDLGLLSNDKASCGIGI
jgi:hypothetical protein